MNTVVGIPVTLYKELTLLLVSYRTGKVTGVCFSQVLAAFESGSTFTPSSTKPRLP